MSGCCDDSCALDALGDAIDGWEITSVAAQVLQAKGAY